MLCNFPWIKTERDGSMMWLPCGKCKGCKIAHSREWAFRLLCELDTYKGQGVFLTLTYDNQHLPKDCSLHKEDLQNFFKRLRRYFEAGKIKYFACGQKSEYGDRFGRCHFHAIVYGVDKSRHSDIISRCWPNGFVDIGTVTYDSCRYVAGYIDKKYGKARNKEEYTDRGLNPPFQIQSQGIGKDWASKHQDYLTKGIVTINGTKIAIPRYFVKKFNLEIERNGTDDFFKEVSTSFPQADKLAALEESGHVKEMYMDSKRTVYGSVRNKQAIHQFS